MNESVNKFYLKIHFVLRNKHAPWLQKIQLMLCREIMFVCAGIHTKHRHALRGQKVRSVNTEGDGIFNYQNALKVLCWCFFF
jgi:hypothetical protein